MAGASGVLTEVTLALLLANQKQPLDLFTYPNDEVQVCVSGRPISHMKYTRYAMPRPNSSVSLLLMLIQPWLVPSQHP